MLLAELFAVCRCAAEKLFLDAAGHEVDLIHVDTGIVVAGTHTGLFTVAGKHINEAVVASGQLGQKLRVRQDFRLGDPTVCEILVTLLLQVLPDIRQGLFFSKDFVGTLLR